MAGAMVPRGAGDQRIQRQERLAELRECEHGIRAEMPVYRLSRDKITGYLWRVFSKHLYILEHKSFKDWFESQQLAITLKTARNYISLYRSSLTSQNVNSDHKKRPQSGKAKFDDRKLVNALGALTKLVHARGKVYGGQPFDQAWAALEAFASAWKRWQHASTK